MDHPKSPVCETIEGLAAALLDSVSEGVLVFRGPGELVYANRAARTIIGDDDGGQTEPAVLAKAELQGVAARKLDSRLTGHAVRGYLVRIPTLSRLAEKEREAILEALAASNWKPTKAARRLGISRTTLWRRLKQYGFAPGRRGRTPGGAP